MNKKMILNNINLEKKQSIGLIHKVYQSQLKNSRKYTASTKTRAEVRGGGRKPWKQKGTGNARSGSNRSSIWVGGGISFGPKPRVVEKKINKKEKLKATLACLFFKFKRIKFFSENENLSLLTMQKTSHFKKILKSFNLNKNAKILILLSKPLKNLFLITRNIKQIKILTLTSLNLKEILICDYILTSEESFLTLKTSYEKKNK